MKEINENRNQTIEVRIREQYENMRGSERKLADVILDAPGDLSSYTATELTSLAGVSKAVGTRLFRLLGFSSYEEAKALAKEEINWGSPLYMKGKSAKHFLTHNDYLNDEMFVLQKSLADLDPQMIESVSEKVVAAKRIYLVGYRNSHFLAQYLLWQLQQFRGDVYLMSAGQGTLGEYIGDFTPDDLLIVCGLRRRPARLERIMKATKERNTPIALFIDHTARSEPSLADWTFYTEVQTSSSRDSLVGALSVARYLIISSFDRAGEQGRAHLKRIEHQHDILGDFD